MTEDRIFDDCARLEDELKLCVLSYMQKSKADSDEKLLVVQATALSFYVTLLTKAGHDPDEIMQITKQGIMAVREDRKRSAA
jgi:hypothetical protein